MLANGFNFFDKLNLILQTPVRLKPCVYINYIIDFHDIFGGKNK